MAVSESGSNSQVYNFDSQSIIHLAQEASNMNNSNIFGNKTPKGTSSTRFRQNGGRQSNFSGVGINNDSIITAGFN